MYLQRTFATPNDTHPNERWALWTLVSDQGDGYLRNETDWFVNAWANPDFIQAQLERIMNFPKHYITSSLPRVIRQVLKESDQLAGVIYPIDLIDSKTQYVSEMAADHLSRMTKIWKPLYNIPSLNDLKLKGKAQRLETNFLRIYAIGVRPNIYIITGSALKGTPEEVGKPFIDPVIKAQIKRLEFVLYKLEELGLEDDPDRYFESAPIVLD